MDALSDPEIEVTSPLPGAQEHDDGKVTSTHPRRLDEVDRPWTRGTLHEVVEFTE